MPDDVFENARKCISESLIRNYFDKPKSYITAGEFYTLSPIRPDNNVGSFSINLNTGVWHDFAGDDGGDFIDLISKAFSLTPIEAAEKIIHDSGKVPPEKKKPTPKKEKNFAPVIPIPQEKLKLLNKHITSKFIVEKFGEPVAGWTYLQADGLPWAAVVRHEKNGKKDIIPYMWCDDDKWHAGAAIKENRPLFNIEKLNGLPVLVVEGEKCASVSLQGYAVVSWMGGCAQITKTDWTPLKGRDVTIWPDADEPGMSAALYIAGQISGAKILDIQGKPKGWDIADAVAEGIDPADFIRDCPRLKTNEQQGMGLLPPDIQTPDADINPFSSRIEQLEMILTQCSDFRRNIITNRTEWAGKNSGQFRDFEDVDFQTLRKRFMQRYQQFKTLPENDLRCVIESLDVSIPYDPIHEYFKMIPAWDGHDHIGDLGDLVHVKPGQFGDTCDAAEVWKNYLHKWLIASVAVKIIHA
jgi:hypothetical protein